jgi:hypothetical protein
MIEIPKHNCRNCGDCCGPLMITKKELSEIKKYIDKNISKKEKNRLKKQKRDPLTCQFRDEKNRNCAIYPVRPEVCRLFGVYDRLPCPYGNSTNLPDSMVPHTLNEERFFLKNML